MISILLTRNIYMFNIVKIKYAKIFINVYI